MAKSGAQNPVTQIPTSTGSCPICGKPAAARHRPFCSPRCANIDLGRWLKGSYSAETDESPEDGAENPER
ncbi:MAG TPA: DNA gyrase inhibitor YacG [Stellaceae bacterium]|jgi:hypothetical protein|nr:DNA gyrase inhibitor YacG [Stellaceae bacterium]